jgi:hypothetical protein
MQDNTRLIEEEFRQKRITDPKTGEVISEEVTAIRSHVPKEPNFIKLYLKDMCKLNDIPKTTNNVLNALLELCNYDNEIVLNSHIKKKIANNLDIKLQSLDNAITKLNKAEFLDRIGRGTYMLNPNIFGKGKWSDVKELQITWDYSNKGRVLEEVKTSVTSQPSLPFNSEDDYIDANIEEKEKPSFLKMDKNDAIDNPVDQLSDKDYIAMLEEQLMEQARADAKDMSPNGFKATRRKK